MKRALWFSRHEPTPEQLAEITRRGFELLFYKDGMIWGARNLAEPSDVYTIHAEVVREIEATGATAIFGVIPAPLRAWWHRNGLDTHPVQIYEAWNVSRPAEGGKATFTHRSWEMTMDLSS